MQITLEIPDRYLESMDRDELERRIKLYAAILLFQAGDLSAGAASEFAGVDRLTFYQEAGALGVPAVSYPPEELEQELENFRRARA